MNNIFIKKSRKLLRFVVYMLLPIGGAWVGGSCTDWNDHYEADSDLTATQSTTLWQNIEQNGNLSQFASLLKRVGYDQHLSSAQSYTIWAPQNDTFDYADWQSASDSVLQQNFIENHIAKTNFLASGKLDKQRVFMLNKKMMIFDGTAGNYTMQGISVTQPNIASINGMLHMLQSNIPYLSNIKETLNDLSNPIDSFALYFQKYDKKELDRSKSVQGPSKNGEITYLEAIYNEDNDLYSLYKAQVQREDSNYTMIIPSNNAWTKAVKTIKSYFNYAPQFDVVQATAAGNDTTIKVKLLDKDQLQDSIVRYMLCHDLFYSNNMYDNGKLALLKSGNKPAVDSLVSTLRSKIYSEDAAALFEGAKRMDCSNGAAWVTDDSLRIRTWMSWNPELKIECETNGMLFKSLYADTRNVTIPVGAKNPKVTGSVSKSGYLEAKPSLDGAHPDLFFYLPGVRSTTYAVYVVMLPSVIINGTIPDTTVVTIGGKDSTVIKTNRMTAIMGYAQSDGTKKTLSMNTTVTNRNNPSQIDTVYVGDFTFPIAYEGTGEYYPFLNLKSRYQSSEKNYFNDVLRLDCIILRPKDLDTYVKQHPEYKYDTDRDSK